MYAYLWNAELRLGMLPPQYCFCKPQQDPPVAASTSPLQTQGMQSPRPAFPMWFAETGPITLDTHQRKQNRLKAMWEKEEKRVVGSKSIRCFPSQLFFHRESGRHHCVVLDLEIVDNFLTTLVNTMFPQASSRGCFLSESMWGSFLQLPCRP